MDKIENLPELDGVFPVGSLDRKLKRLSDTEHLISCWNPFCCRYKNKILIIQLKIFNSGPQLMRRISRSWELWRKSQNVGFCFLFFVLRMLECQTFQFHKVTTGLLAPHPQLLCVLYLDPKCFQRIIHKTKNYKFETKKNKMNYSIDSILT